MQLGAEYRVGKHHTHLLMSTKETPSCPEEEKAELKRRFQLDSQFELKFVGCK